MSARAGSSGSTSSLRAHPLTCLSGHPRVPIFILRGSQTRNGNTRSLRSRAQGTPLLACGIEDRRIFPERTLRERLGTPLRRRERARLHRQALMSAGGACQERDPVPLRQGVACRAPEWKEPHCEVRRGALESEERSGGPYEQEYYLYRFKVLGFMGEQLA